MTPFETTIMDQNYTDDADRFVSALGRAIAHWQSGRRIPMTLAAELMEQGYDVPALERKHLN